MKIHENLQSVKIRQTQIGYHIHFRIKKIPELKTFKSPRDCQRFQICHFVESAIANGGNVVAAQIQRGHVFGTSQRGRGQRADAVVA